MLAGGATEAVSFAAGVAIAPTLAPVLQELENTTWQSFPNRPPTIYTVVQGVAEGQIAEADGRTWSHEQGFSDHVFDALLAAAHSGPAFGNLMDAYRRGLLDDTMFTRGLIRLGIETEWFPALAALKRTLLSPAEAANARQQQFISPAEQVRIAGEHGIEPQDAEVQFELAGLPPGPVQMMQAINRGLTDRATFDQAIAEGHTKTKYTDLLFNMRRHLLTPHEYEEAALRGVMTPAEADAGAALSGMEPQDAQLLFEIMGRPLAVHEITRALAHGVTLGGSYADVPEPYRDAIRRSNIRPEYARMAYAARYTYPSAFVLRSLTQSGDLTEQQAHEILTFEGWEPDLAAQVAKKWAEPAAGKADPWVTKAENHTWTKLQTDYIKGAVTADQATVTLQTIGVDAAVYPRIFELWDAAKAV